jgi:hypothetical protein
MRKASGVLMIVLGTATMGIFLYGLQPYYSAELKLIVILTTAFTIAGGVFCLKRKYWTICFISSLLLLYFVVLWGWFLGPLIYLFIAGGIISAIFVYRRKREWQELHGHFHMRKVAGILMVIFGMTTISIFVCSIYRNPLYYSLHFSLAMIFSTVFIITGGVFCLRKEYWIVCLISSVLFPCFVILLWSQIPYGAFSPLSMFFVPVGIISAVFVGLGKREWQESLA